MASILFSSVISSSVFGSNIAHLSGTLCFGLRRTSSTFFTFIASALSAFMLSVMS